MKANAHVLQRYINMSAPAWTLAAARIVFGVVMIISCVRFIALGWIDEQYVLPRWHFPYQGFEWVQTLGAPGMYIVFAAMLVAAVGITIGAWYRWSSILFFLTFTYVELIDKTYYLNHYYFVSVLSFVLCFLPAHLSWSVDVWRKPKLKAEAIPRWTVDIVKLHIAMVYVYAGLAKINQAWLFDAMPLRIWMPANDTLPIVGPLLTLWWMPWVFSWVGMLYDLTIPFWLMNKRTRIPAYLCVVVFHTLTGMMFQIGVFPWGVTGLRLVFCFPTSCGVVVKTEPLPKMQLRITSVPRIITGILAVHVVIQLLVPWRFLFYTNDLFWDEEGYRFGWRVMLMEKAGTAAFPVTDRVSGRTGYVDNREFLNAHQEKQMAMQPDMIVQYAKMLHDHYQQLGMNDPIVRAEVWVTLNGASSLLLVDPTTDLARKNLSMKRNDWVLARASVQ